MWGRLIQDGLYRVIHHTSKNTFIFHICRVRVIEQINKINKILRAYYSIYAQQGEPIHLNQECVRANGNCFIRQS